MLLRKIPLINMISNKCVSGNAFEIVRHKVTTTLYCPPPHPSFT